MQYCMPIILTPPAHSRTLLSGSRTLCASGPAFAADMQTRPPRVIQPLHPGRALGSCGCGTLGHRMPVWGHAGALYSRLLHIVKEHTNDLSKLVWG